MPQNETLTTLLGLAAIQLSDWNEATDEQQIEWCNMLIKVYSDSKGKLYDDMLADAHDKSDPARQTVAYAAEFFWHDAARLKNNLDLYANRPKEGANDRMLRQQTFYKFLHYAFFLFYIDHYFMES